MKTCAVSIPQLYRPKAECSRNSEKKIRIFYTNADSLLNKLTELNLIISSNDYQVVCITESNLNDDIKKAEIYIPNFDQIFLANRKHGDKGGSIVYVHNSIKAEQLKAFDGCESLALKLLLDEATVTLVCLYRSPSLSVEGNDKLLQHLKSLPDDPNENLIIVGDVNLPDVDWNLGTVNAPPDTNDVKLVNQQKYMNAFLEKGLTWYIKDTYTRRRLYGNTIQQSLLDQVFTSNDALIYDIAEGPPLGKSDHVVLDISLNLSSMFGFTSSIHKNWSKIKEADVLNWSKEIDWNYSENNNEVEDYWKELHSKLLTFVESVPDTIVKFDKSGNRLAKLPWDNSKLVRKRKEKVQAWKHFNEEPTMINYHYCMSKQDEFRKAETKAKIKYEKKISSNVKRNSKPIFRYLRSKLKVNKTVTSVKKSDGSCTNTPEETANELADFFHTVFKDEVYGPLPKSFYNPNTVEYSEQILVQIESVKKLLSAIDVSKAFGPDNIHPKLLRYLSSDAHFVLALTKLFQVCVEKECIPLDWKVAHVVSIHKKGPLNQKDNYRPISLTSMICKLYEKLLRDHILSQVELKICPEQHGFVHGKSCLSNLLETLQDVINCVELDDFDSADILYFDFQKAFDQVSHHKLLIKMKNLGIDRKSISIIKDFLQGRTMKVKVGDTFSLSKEVLSGVIQGSVIGPLLFIIFVNDLPNCIYSLCKLFADDLKLIVSPTNFSVTSLDLQSLVAWQDAWCLYFNLDKCKVLHIGKNNPMMEYSLDTGVINPVDHEKDLGVNFSKKFNFISHIESCVAKAKSSTAWLFRNFVSREQETIKHLYKSLIRPHLEYCPQVWAPLGRHGNWSSILNIESVQRWVTSCIQGMDNLSYRQRLEKLNLTTLFERRMRGDLIEVFKALNGYSSIASNVIKQSDRTGNLLVNERRKRSTRKMENDFFGSRVATYWNKLPSKVKNSTSVNDFKNNLGKFRENNHRQHPYGQFWELSEEVFQRIY